MQIETKMFTLEPSVFRRAANRTYWALLWPVSLLGLVGIVGFWVVRIPVLSTLCLVIAISIPFAVAESKVRQMRLTESFGAGCKVEFGDDGVTEYSPYKSTHASYEQYTSFERIKEGIRMTRRNASWTLIPRDAFASDGDYQEVCRFLIKIGKMRQGLSEL